MPKRARGLTTKQVEKERRIGLFGDGGGLYLRVVQAVTGEGREPVPGAVVRSWVFRYRAGRKLRSMGLGSTATLGLADARNLARDLRMQRLQGIDPIEARRAARAVPLPRVTTF